MKTAFLYFVPFGALFFALWFVERNDHQPTIENELLPQRAQLTTAATGVVALSVSNINQRIELSRQRLEFMELQLDKLQGITKVDTTVFDSPGIDTQMIIRYDTMTNGTSFPFSSRRHKDILFSQQSFTRN